MLRKLLIFISLIFFTLSLTSCMHEIDNQGYGVVAFKTRNFKSSEGQQDSVEVINFRHRDSAKFKIDGGYMLGSSVYSHYLHAFGYYGLDSKYHFYNVKGKEVLTLSMPFALQSVRIDDSSHLLVGTYNNGSENKFAGYNYLKDKPEFEFSFSNSYAFPICCSAYNSTTKSYYIFAVSGSDTTSTLLKFSIDSGLVSVVEVPISPVVTVFDKRQSDLLVLGHRAEDSTKLNFYLFRIDPDSGQILDSVFTPIDIVQACSAGLDYEKNAFVTLTLGPNLDRQKVVFLDVTTGQIIEEHTISKAQNILFWRE